MVIKLTFSRLELHRELEFLDVNDQVRDAPDVAEREEVIAACRLGEAGVDLRPERVALVLEVVGSFQVEGVVELVEAAEEERGAFRFPDHWSPWRGHIEVESAVLVAERFEQHEECVQVHGFLHVCGPFVERA